MSIKDWKWCGHPHHFVGAHDCDYHLATFVAGGRFLVSTVGAYRPGGQPEMMALGFGDSFFETMVFATSPTNLTDGEPSVLSWSDEACERYSTVAEANAGHIKLCRQFDRVKP